MGRNKTHLDLLDRIKNLDVYDIDSLSPDVIARVTDDFDESLVRNLIYKGLTRNRQKEIIKSIKNSYKTWKKNKDFTWGIFPSTEVYPDFINDLEMDIECGFIITPDGKKSDKDYRRKQLIQDRIINSNNSVSKRIQKAVLNSIEEEDDDEEEDDNAIQKLSINNDHTQDDNQKIIEKQEKRIKELEKEVNELKGQTERANELENEVNELKELLNTNAESISWHDKVRLELALRFMEEAGCNLNIHGNKARAARIINTITGLPFSTCSNYATNRNLNTNTHKEEVAKINSALQALEINFIL